MKIITKQGFWLGQHNCNCCGSTYILEQGDLVVGGTYKTDGRYAIAVECPVCKFQNLVHKSTTSTHHAN
jgi:rubredoxin